MKVNPVILINLLTLLHSEQSKLYGVLTVLSATGLNKGICKRRRLKIFEVAYNKLPYLDLHCLSSSL